MNCVPILNPPSINDSVGASFIGQIITIDASGGDSSYSRGSSSLSMAQSKSGSSKEQSVNSISSSSENVSYSVHVLKFGEIVGSELGTVSLSSGSNDLTRIQGSGNDKSSDSYGWSSRSATISSHDRFSVYGTFHGLSGSIESGGDLADGFILWSLSSGSSLTGTMTQGSVFQHAAESATNGQASTTRGFSRHESTTDLAMSDDLSANNFFPVPTLTESFAVDGITTFASYTIIKPVPPAPSGGSGGGTGGVGEPGGGTGAPNWTQVIAVSEINRTVLSLNTTTTGDDVSRALANGQTIVRTVVDQIIYPNQRTGSSVRTRSGNAIDYNGTGGYENLITSDFVSFTTATFREIFNETFVGTVNPLMEMNDWVTAETVTKSNSFTASTSPFNPIRVSTRTMDGIENRTDGRVDFSERIILSGLGFSSDYERTVSADETDVSSSVTEIVTRGVLGYLPSKVVETQKDSKNYLFKFDIDINAQSTTEIGEDTYTFKLESHDTFRLDRDITEVKQSTTFVAQTDEVEDETVTTGHKTTFEQNERRTSSSESTTSGPSGPSTHIKNSRWNEKHSLTINHLTGGQTGYIKGSSYDYDSMLWLYPIGGGEPTHTVTSDWNISLNQAPTITNEGTDDESYSPYSRLQDGDDEGQTVTSEEIVDAYFELFPELNDPWSKAFATLLRQGKFIIQVTSHSWSWASDSHVQYPSDGPGTGGPYRVYTFSFDDNYANPYSAALELRRMILANALDDTYNWSLRSYAARDAMYKNEEASFYQQMLGMRRDEASRLITELDEYVVQPGFSLVPGSEVYTATQELQKGNYLTAAFEVTIGGLPFVVKLKAPSTGLYRGGSSLQARLGVDVKAAADGLIHPLAKNGKPQGLSLNINPLDPFIQKYGGAFPVNSLPEGLQALQSGKTGHFVIAPKVPMTFEAFQKLLSQVKLGDFNILP